VVAHAQTVFTWTGGGTAGVTSDSNNWLDGLGPTGTGSVLENVTFGDATGPSQSVVVPSTGLVLHDLNFTGASRPAYTFSGRSSPTFTITGDVTAAAGGNILLDSSLNVALASDLLDNAHTISVDDANLTVNVQSILSGSGASITKSGSGTLALTNAGNNYSGTTTINAGTLLVSGSLGAVASQVTVNSGGTLGLAGDTLIFNPVTLNSGSKLTGQGYLNNITIGNGVSGSFTLGSNLVLDTSNFLTGFPTTTFSLVQTGNNFALNFTPVPEPSTCALMVTGAGAIL
jgi:autotransporter-associated beta strand protein